jgi:hypothetical protein
MVDMLQTKFCFSTFIEDIRTYIPDTIDGSNTVDTGRCRQS